MNVQDTEIQLDMLMAAAKAPSGTGAIVTVSGILAIATAMYAMLPSWAECREKDALYWMMKAFTAMLIVVCTVLVVQHLVGSADKQVGGNVDEPVKAQD